MGRFRRARGKPAPAKRPVGRLPGGARGTARGRRGAAPVLPARAQTLPAVMDSDGFTFVKGPAPGKKTLKNDRGDQMLAKTNPMVEDLINTYKEKAEERREELARARRSAEECAESAALCAEPVLGRLCAKSCGLCGDAPPDAEAAEADIATEGGGAADGDGAVEDVPVLPQADDEAAAGEAAAGAHDAGGWWFVDDVEECVGYEEGECSRASSRARGAVEERGGEGAPRRGAKSARGSRE